jgi:protein SCO1
MKSKFNYYWLLILAPVAFITWFFISKKENKPVRQLAYFGPRRALKTNDTSYHSVQGFTFTNQDNEIFTQENVKGKIYVTEYFFTTCQSICPIMNKNLEKVYSEFKSNYDVLILSHTVDPETDTISALKNYAKLHKVNDARWQFVTGEKQQLYSMARKSYLLNAEEGNGGAEDFIHTQNFALIDKEKHIRGFYDGTDSLEIIRLIQDIKVLRGDYEYKNNN